MALSDTLSARLLDLQAKMDRLNARYATEKAEILAQVQAVKSAQNKDLAGCQEVLDVLAQKVV